MAFDLVIIYDFRGVRIFAKNNLTVCWTTENIQDILIRFQKSFVTMLIILPTGIDLSKLP